MRPTAPVIPLTRRERHCIVAKIGAGAWVRVLAPFDTFADAQEVMRVLEKVQPDFDYLIAPERVA